MKIRGFEIVSDRFRKHPNVDIKLPTRATSKSSGYDFYLPIDVTLYPNEKVLVFSDIKAYMQDDEELLLFPRSSIAIKKGVVITNTIGKVDADYYSNPSNDGGIGIALWNTSENRVTLKAGERVCQGTFYKYLTVDNDKPLSDLRSGGIGSSGE